MKRYLFVFFSLHVYSFTSRVNWSQLCLLSSRFKKPYVFFFLIHPNGHGRKGMTPKHVECLRSLLTGDRSLVVDAENWLYV